MSMISHQIDELKNTEKVLREHHLFVSANNVREAIDTIKSLSAKVRKLNIGVTNQTHEIRTETHGVCSDVISRQAALSEFVDGRDVYDIMESIEQLKPVQVPNSDLISRQAAIDALISEGRSVDSRYISAERIIHENDAIEAISMLPSADRPTGKWTTEQVAELLANLFGDECACNFNDNDEWLPSACKYADTQCPDPKEKHGCWMQFLIQGGGTGE